MKFNHSQKEALQKMLNVGIDKAVDMLNYITETPIAWELNPIKILSLPELQSELELTLGQEIIVGMELVFSGEFQGSAQLIFPKDSAALLVNSIANEDRRMLDRDALRRETIVEVGNIFFNGIMGVISTVVARGITYMIPSYQEGTIQQLTADRPSRAYQVALLAQVQFKIKENPEAGKQQLHSFSRILPSKYVKLFVDKSQTGKYLIFFLKVDKLDNLLVNINQLSDYFSAG
jgi:chemotaxis protein CheY-P-specific phosphatase CheC